MGRSHTWRGGVKMGSYLSAEKSAAKKTGVTVEEWRSRRAGGERHCFRCREWKRIDAFSKDKSRPQGRTASCKPCSSMASTASRYGLSVKKLKEILATANGKCSLCHTPSQNLVVDHSHTSGGIRGILCNSCNVAIGLFKRRRVVDAKSRALCGAFKWVGSPPFLGPITHSIRGEVARRSRPGARTAMRNRCRSGTRASSACGVRSALVR